jgi:hypothetical protein
MTTLTGTVVNGMVVFDSGQSLPEGTKVDVAVRSAPTASDAAGLTLAERLLRHAGTVPDLPPDFAAQHDHYIHGTPKR